MLQVADYPLSYFRRYITGDQKAEVAEGSVSKEIFRTSEHMSKASDDKYESVTLAPELVVNEETAVRVLDTPGFADTRRTAEVGLHKANLQCFRNIAQEQVDKNLQVRRVLYFYPNRGTPEKADGVLQEELDVMHHYFGEEIFKCMVIVATLDKSVTNMMESSIMQSLPEDKCKEFLEEQTVEIVATTSEVISNALEKVTGHGKKYENLPSVIVAFLNEKGSDVVYKVKRACVIEEKIFVPEFKQTACAQCGAKTVFSTDEKVLIGTK